MAIWVGPKDQGDWFSVDSSPAMMQQATYNCRCNSHIVALEKPSSTPMSDKHLTHSLKPQTLLNAAGGSGHLCSQARYLQETLLGNYPHNALVVLSLTLSLVRPHAES